MPEHSLHASGKRRRGRAAEDLGVGPELGQPLGLQPAGLGGGDQADHDRSPQSTKTGFSAASRWRAVRQHRQPRGGQLGPAGRKPLVRQQFQHRADPLHRRQGRHDPQRTADLERSLERRQASPAEEHRVRLRAASCSTSGMVPWTTSTVTRCVWALAATRAQASASLSTATTSAPNRAHSTATDPLPLPRSQTTVPVRGARWASARARTSALVTIESRWSKAVSGRAQPSGTRSPPAIQPMSGRRRGVDHEHDGGLLPSTCRCLLRGHVDD